MSAPLRRRRSSASANTLRIPDKRWIVAAVLALLLAAGSYTGYRFWLAASKVNGHASLGDVVGLAQNQQDTPGTLAYKIHHGERVNVLMLGYGGAGHDGAYLTDSILIVSVQGPDRVALTSVPRDTWVKIQAFANGGEYDGKINAAYEIPLLQGAFGKVQPQYDQSFNGGGALASKVIGDYLGIPIDYWVGVDFGAFQKVVDTIGGVDVVNPYVLDDYQYPLGETGRVMHIHFDPGPLHLTGDQALIYVRERHADSDFGRSRRQQQVITAIKDKALKIGALPQLFGLLDALQENVKTNMSLNDIKTFGGVANKISSDATHHVSIDNTNWQYDTTSADGQYILLPRDHTMAYLHNFMAAEMVDPTVLAEKANIQFASTPGQGSVGQDMGGIWAALLHMLNFQTLAPRSGVTAPATTEIHDYSGGKDAKTVAWLQQYFNGVVVPETGPPPAPVAGATASPGAAPAPPVSPDIVVVLGKNFTAGFDAAERPVYRPPSNYVPPAFHPSPVAPPPPTPSKAPAPPPPSPTAPSSPKPPSPPGPPTPHKSP
jgi:LCP family protein required for cell wall assembly